MRLNRRRNPNAEPIQDVEHHPEFLAGVAAFNAGKHWHAHEHWEHVWMGLEGDEKLFLQALIMGAAMLVQYEKGVWAGALNHFENVRVRMAGQPRVRFGVDGVHFQEQLQPFATAADRQDGTLPSTRVQIQVGSS